MSKSTPQPVFKGTVSEATPRTSIGGYVDIVTTGGLAARVPLPEGEDLEEYADRLEGQPLTIGGDHA